jgi:tryptophan 2,3-dioxygenase
MSYGDYLRLDKLLGAQQPRSQSHDELLFIIIHQATELWLKLMLHEVAGAQARLRADDLEPAFKMLARVSRIQAQIIQSWDVLSTLTPADYASFRDSLGRSSGFQSHGYRLLEFALGHRDAAMLAPYRHDRALSAKLAAALAEPSLYDEAVRLVARRGLPIARAVLERDLARPWRADASVRAAWGAIYRDTETYWELYQLAEKLVDIEDWFQQWRFRHMKTVERIIGMKTGTGGSTGVSYLKRALDYAFFPELWQVRTDL